MQKWWVSVFLVFGIICLMIVSALLYFKAGLSAYIRVNTVIKSMSSEEQRVAREEFYGTDQRGVERGIFAGIWMDKVWVWQRAGLKSFAVDNDSVYSWFDGCRDDIRARLNKGEANVIQRLIYTDLVSWSKQVRVGDYVVVYPAIPENGGTAGNLREIYAYNFWLFMHKGIDTECAK